MPIYEYHCKNCENKFEKIIFRQPDPIECPNCKSQQTRRLISAFALTSEQSVVRTGIDETGPCACGAPQRGMCSN